MSAVVVGSAHQAAVLMHSYMINTEPDRVTGSFQVWVDFFTYAQPNCEPVLREHSAHQLTPAAAAAAAAAGTYVPRPSAALDEVMDTLFAQLVDAQAVTARNAFNNRTAVPCFACSTPLSATTHTTAGGLAASCATLPLFDGHIAPNGMHLEMRFYGAIVCAARATCSLKARRMLASIRREDLRAEKLEEKARWRIARSDANVLVANLSESDLDDEDGSIFFGPSDQSVGSGTANEFLEVVMGLFPAQQIDRCGAGCAALRRQSGELARCHALNVCGQCRAERYCSTACQRRHWATHRNTCVAAADSDNLVEFDFD